MENSFVPEQRRPLAGIAAAAVALALVAVPMLWTGLFAYASFTGCFLSCSEPDLGSGVLWGSLTAMLLAVPIGTGLLVARVRAAWWLTPLLAVAVLAAALLVLHGYGQAA